MINIIFSFMSVVLVSRSTTSITIADFFPPKRGVEFNLNPPKRGVEFNLSPPKLPISSRQIDLPNDDDGWRRSAM